MAVLSREHAASGEVSDREWTEVFSSRWMLAVILVLVFAAYAPTLNDWFTGDDFWFLHSAQSQPFGDYAQRAFDYRETGSLPELNRYRPLYPIAWKLQYEVFGQEAAYYHAVVLCAHLVTVVMAWFVFRRLLGGGWLANLATLLFGLHPIHGSAIAWLASNRVFAGLPYIAALLLFLKYRDGAGRWQWPSYAGSLLLYIVAILMHSSATTLAAVLPLYVFLVEKEPREALRARSWLPFLPFLLVAAAYTLVQWQARDELGAEGAFLFGWHQFGMYGWLSGMLVVPIETFEPGHFDAVVEKVQLIGAAAFIFLGFAVMYRRPMWGLGVFAWLWFLLALLPDSTFIAGASGRMLYVAGFAGALMLVVMMLYVRELLPPRPRAAAIAAAPYVLMCAAVPIAVFAYTRANGVAKTSAEYEGFAQELQRSGPEVPAGGSLYVIGAPERGAFSPDSHVQSLVGLYYGDTSVVVVKPGEPTPTLGRDDRIFTYAR